MWIYRRTSWVLPCRKHDCFESKTIYDLSMFPFIHILSGKYLTSILTIPRPAIRHRTLRKRSWCTLSLFNQCGTWLCHPQGVLSTWGYGIERRQSVCARSASADLQSSCIDLSPRTCAGLSRDHMLKVYLFPRMLSWRTMLGWYISHSWLFKKMLCRSWDKT